MTSKYLSLSLFYILDGINVFMYIIWEIITVKWYYEKENLLGYT